jgi:hypothetical protein
MVVGERAGMGTLMYDVIKCTRYLNSINYLQ